jgi:putative endonuclease
MTRPKTPLSEYEMQLRRPLPPDVLIDANNECIHTCDTPRSIRKAKVVRKDDHWTLYLLYHKDSNRTYLGVTTDVYRRLRQHRGEIVGGAKFTERIRKAHPLCNWDLVATLSPFPNQAEVTRWERLLKLRTRGLNQRLNAMLSLANGLHPDSFTKSQKEKYVCISGLTLTKINEV